MAGVLSRWILRKVLASGLAFERQAIDTYRVLREKLLKPGRCDEALESSLGHLLEEEQTHEQILSDAAAGRLSVEDLEATLTRRVYSRFDAVRPLQGEETAPWRPDLLAALEQEQDAWIFYGNLGRMSRIPAAKKAFQVLAAMEKEHAEILRRLLGIAGGRKA